MTTASADPSLPLLRLGFRPFYLGAAAFAVVGMLLWLWVFSGRLVPASGLAPVLWHAHEMMFGFIAAVIVGFLLTAGRAWTGLPTPRGARLAALFVLWAAARVAALVAPYPVYVVLDVAFLPLVAFIFGEVLWRARNRRNYGVAGVLAALALANVAFHLGAAGVVALPPLVALHAAIAAVVVLETVIGGRIVPSFTANATPGLTIAPAPKRDRAVLVFTIAGLVLWLLPLPPLLAAGVLLIAAALHAWRALAWAPGRTFGRPILWILHFAYAWIPAGLALLALAQLGWLPESAAVHALTVGSMGGLIIGMMTRTARGHTGRALSTGRAETVAYVLVLAAALLRVFAPVVAPAWAVEGWIAAGAAWTLAFVIYLVVYTPWLLAPRLDGKDG